MADGHEQDGVAATQVPPSEQERSEIDQRAAYEAELSRITSSEMIVQTAVSLINIGGRRLGLASASAGGQPSVAESERDLEQVRDAIDGASALLPILERRMPGELGPLRDAIAQLQVAYAREAQSAGSTTPTASQVPPAQQPTPTENDEKSAGNDEKPVGNDEKPVGNEEKPVGNREQPTESGRQDAPGPAQASGRLWVPGR